MKTTNPIPGLCAVWMMAWSGPSNSDPSVHDIDAMLASALAADSATGMQVAVMRDGVMLYDGAAGNADIEQSVPIRPDTRLRIGSVSKIFTYALALALVDMGQLDPDADIRSYLSEFPDKGAAITARQLAAHTSGIRHYDFSNRAEANNQVYYERLADALRVFSADPLLAAPGEAFNYSSYGVNLLGVVTAAVNGSAFGDAVRQLVLEPLELSDSTIDHPLQVVPRRGRFYTRWGGRLVNTPWRDSSDYYPSGGMLSSAHDLATLTQAMFAGEFLSPAGKLMLRSEATLNDGEGVGYSFGWQMTASGNVFYHGGETNGGYAFVYRDDRDNLVIAGIANYNIFPQDEEPRFFVLVRENLPALFGGEAIR